VAAQKRRRPEKLLETVRIKELFKIQKGSTQQYETADGTVHIFERYFDLEDRTYGELDIGSTLDEIAIVWRTKATNQFQK
jgi:hypothetical protein